LGELAILFIGTLVATVLCYAGDNLDVPLVILLLSLVFTLAVHAVITLWKFRRELLLLPVELRWLVWWGVMKVLVLPLLWAIPSLSVGVIWLLQDTQTEQMIILGPVVILALVWVNLAFENGFSSGLYKAREQACLHIRRASQANRLWQQDPGGELQKPRAQQAIQLRDQFTEATRSCASQDERSLDTGATS
jgi:hypothetical protein